jgi:hypothetical protein
MLYKYKRAANLITAPFSVLLVPYLKENSKRKYKDNKDFRGKQAINNIVINIQ